MDINQEQSMDDKADGAVVGYLRSADNGILREHRRIAREMVALLKLFDKDLQTLTSFNDNDGNLTMMFNDAALDEAQRLNAAKEATTTWGEIRRLVSSQTQLTSDK